jgi:glycosyltransferase involved in cell wall biosynthesis
MLHRCYRGSASLSGIAAATIAVGRSRRTWQQVALFLAPSRYVRSVFISAGMDPERIAVKPNVVPDPGTRKCSPSASRTVVFAGRLSEEKGVHVLLEAWRSVSSQNGWPLELEIVGDGPLRKMLEENAPRAVRFRGWIPTAELSARLLTARALVFPSVWPENFGRVTIEALAAGLPVLASDLATPAETIGDLGREWLEKPGDVAAWSAALRGLLDDVTLANTGKRARKLFEQRYSLRAGVEGLLGAYDRVCRVPCSRRTEPPREKC